MNRNYSNIFSLYKKTSNYSLKHIINGAQELMFCVFSFLKQSLTKRQFFLAIKNKQSQQKVNTTNCIEYKYPVSNDLESIISDSFSPMTEFLKVFLLALFTRYRKQIKLVFFLLFFIHGSILLLGQEITPRRNFIPPPQDTISPFSLQDTIVKPMPKDTLALANDSTKKKKPTDMGIEADVQYTAKDSIITTFEGSKKVYLYGDAEVKYLDITLTAACIELDLDSSMTYAYGTKDSLGVEAGLPVFTDKSGSYEMRTIKYNFKTEKALIEHVVTEQGEGYVVSERAKKLPEDYFFIKDGRYSTCSNHDHPHFYLNLTKAKVIPGKKTITGPAYLVVEDIPLKFVVLPFALIPSTSSYSSGIIMPTYGEESTRGLFLRNGGYYWAANDYFDLAVTGDIYSNSSWGIKVASKYKLNYKFSGNFNLQYIETVSSEKYLPDYSKTKDFSVTWSHKQDSKANPYQSFSASVNFSTSSYDKNNVTSVIDAETVATTTKRSSISYSRKFPNTPFNFSANIIGSQNSTDSSVSVTLPNLTLTMSKIFPFKRQNKVGNKEAWYEKIGFSYSGTMKNSLKAHEDEVFHTPLNQWENGIKHSIPVSMNLKALKYFTITPSVSYTERWYTNKITQGWDEEEEEIIETDTINGFYRVWDYSSSISTSTKFYTFYRPSRKLFGDKINAIRHVMTPSVSLSTRPDFSKSKYGYYDWFEYYDPDQDSVIHEEYSYFEDGLYGTPGSGKSGSLGISLGNTLEMKVKSDQDSSGYKKISILESLNFSASHNFLKDTLKWSTISMSGRTKIFGTSISFGAVFDPYAVDTTSSGSVVKINESQLKHTGKLVRLTSANLSFGMSIGSEKFKKMREEKSGETESQEEMPEEETQDPLNSREENGDRIGDQFADTRGKENTEIDEDGYTRFKFPWNLSLNYSFRLSNGSFDKTKMAYKKTITSSVNMSGNFSLTPKWKFTVSSGYNFSTQKISHTNLRLSRDLHCWGMNFNVIPFGTYKSYYFSISVNSSLLQDLKYEKRNSTRSSSSYF